MAGLCPTPLGRHAGRAPGRDKLLGRLHGTIVGRRALALGRGVLGVDVVDVAVARTLLQGKTNLVYMMVVQHDADRQHRKRCPPQTEYVDCSFHRCKDSTIFLQPDCKVAISRFFQQERTCYVNSPCLRWHTLFKDQR